MLLACAALSCRAATSDVVLADGFEPPCYGVANDRPGCIVVPFNQAPLTANLPLSGTSHWDRLDVYVLLDLSGSLATEFNTLKNNLNTRLNALRCDPVGIGEPGECYDDLWAGLGTFAFSDNTANAYLHRLDLQQNPNVAAVPLSTPSSSSTLETTWLAQYSTLSGAGGAICARDAVVARVTCSGSPAGSDGLGYACFRPDAGAVVMLLTDEQPSTCFTCPDWATAVKAQYLETGARLVPLVGSGATLATVDELKAQALDTGAFDGTGVPLVYSAADANADDAFAQALQDFRIVVPMRVHAQLLDSPVDAVDVSAFVQRIEVINDGSNGCPSALPVSDEDEDGTPDTFLGPSPGTKVCFRIVAKSNTGTPATGSIQFFPATLRLVGDVRMRLAEIPLTFAVPAGM